jgi:hypothetical protein
MSMAFAPGFYNNPNSIMLSDLNSQFSLVVAGQRTQVGSVFFPILAVKGYHNNFSDRSRLQATHIDAVTVGIGSRNIEGFNPAHFAKQMLGDTGVECVG